jgi:hypothetical protein
MTERMTKIMPINIPKTTVNNTTKRAKSIMLSVDLT